MHPWRERLHRWFEPAARRSPLSPNAITAVALLLNLAAAILFARQLFVPAIALLIVGGAADAFDGIVARVQQKATRFGDFLDHAFDRISDLALIIGWLLGNPIRIDLALATVFAVMLNGYLGTQIEATWGERRYDAVGRGEFVLALIVLPLASVILSGNGWSELTFGSLRIAEWLSILLVAAALLGIAQRFRIAWSLGRQ